MMKKVFVLLALLAAVGIANAELLTNTSFESYGDDGYGRMMPGDPYGLYYTGDWNLIPDCEVKTGDAHTGNAAFMLDATNADANPTLTAGVGNVPGTGETYILSAWIKSDSGVNAVFGAAMFAPDYAGWWWSGNTAVPDTGGIWQQITYEITVGAPSAWNLEVAAFPGSSAFLIDDVSFSLVPEPATMALLGLGALVLRRKK